MTKNCFIWSRVSTKHQEENGGSLDDQKCRCEKYARENGYTIKGYFGGKHESAKTPGKLIKEMIKAVKKDKSVKYIIVNQADLKPKRISFTSTTFWFFLASFSRLACSKRYLP